MKITSSNLSLFSGKELLAFATGAQRIVLAKKEKVPAVLPFLTEVQLKTSNFQAALERESSNPLIKLRNQQARNREGAFLTLRNFSESALTRRKEGVPAAAQSIVMAIRKHGWAITPVGEKKRTGIFKDILSELSGKYANEIAIIGAADYLDEFEKEEEAYEELSKQIAEKAAEIHEPTVVDTRPELIAALKQLLQIVSLQTIAAPSADVDELIAALRKHITQSMASAKAAETRAEHIVKPGNKPPQIK